MVLDTFNLPVYVILPRYGKSFEIVNINLHFGQSSLIEKPSLMQYHWNKML